MKNATYKEIYSALKDLQETVIMEYVLQEKSQLSVADFVLIEMRVHLALCMKLINENMALYLLTLCAGYKRAWKKLNDVEN